MAAKGPTDEQRWDLARKLLPGGGGVDSDAFVRQRRRTWLGLLGVVLAVALLALGVTLGFALAGHHTHRVHPDGMTSSGWANVLGFVALTAAVLLTLIAAAWFVRLGRSNRFRWRWNAPTAPLTRAQRRTLLKQIRGKRPVDAETLPIAQFLANQIRWQLPPTGVLVVGMFCFLGSEVLFHRREHDLVICASLLCYLVVLAPFLIREIRSAGRFLTAHPSGSAHE